ncbi:hypothetical protein [Rossellomorea marisflavi]|nr:hypothetical protein [Rossellomorea marisflavi]
MIDTIVSEALIVKRSTQKDFGMRRFTVGLPSGIKEGTWFIFN